MSHSFNGTFTQELVNYDLKGWPEHLEQKMMLQVCAFHRPPLPMAVVVLRDSVGGMPLE